MDDPENGSGPSSAIPVSIDVSRATRPDHFHPIPIDHAIPVEAQDIPRMQHDYTENASQAELDAIARERKATEGLGDFMVGSMTGWAGDGGDGKT